MGSRLGLYSFPGVVAGERADRAKLAHNWLKTASSHAIIAFGPFFLRGTTAKTRRN